MGMFFSHRITNPRSDCLPVKIQAAGRNNYFMAGVSTGIILLFGPQLLLTQQYLLPDILKLLFSSCIEP